METRLRFFSWRNILVGSTCTAAIAALLWGQTRPEYAEYEIRIITTMTSTSRNPAAGEPTIATVYFARRDGSLDARTIEVFNNRPCTSTAYWDAGKREQVNMSDCIAMKTTTPFARFPRPLAIPEASCYPKRMDRFTGNDVIQGVPVEKLEDDNPSVKSVTFVAPSLGCLTVRSLFYWKDKNGNITHTTFNEPIDVKIGPPDPALFGSPSNYREVLPSERRDALDRYFQGTNEAAACLREGNEREDKTYLEARQSRQREGTTIGWVNTLRARVFGTRLIQANISHTAAPQR